jgi:gliding motility-associated-like protein
MLVAILAHALSPEFLIFKWQMKKILLITALTVTVLAAFAQCPSTVQMNHTTNCLGSAKLNIAASKDTVTAITWYDNGNALGIVRDSMETTIQTVAGGNGSGPNPNQTIFPVDIFLDSIGAIYLLLSDRVLWFPPGSTGATDGIVFAGAQGQGGAANEFDAPAGLFVDKAGSIYVADAHNNRVQKWRPGSDSGITVAGTGGLGSGPNQLFNPSSVFLDANGNMYVTDNGNNRIQKFAPGSTFGVTVAGGNGLGSAASQFHGVQKVFVDQKGNLYASDFGNHRVQKFAPFSTSASNGITVAGGNGAGTAANQVAFPHGLYVDSAGNVYVGDEVNNRVQEWAPGAAFGATVAGGNGQGGLQNQLYNPRGISVDARGYIYIADAVNNRAQKWGTRPAINSGWIPAQAGTYTAVVTDTAGCVMTSNAVIIYPMGVSSVSIAASSGNICSGDTVVFVATPSNGGPTPSYQWRVNGKETGTNSDKLTIHSLADGDSVNCILSSSLTCVQPVPAQDAIVMTVRPVPAISMGNDTVIAPGKSVPLDPSVSGNITTWQWTPATGLDDPSKPHPLAKPVNTTTYQLNVVSDNGCTASGKTRIIVYYTLQMPGAFTPNGDGKNDLFRIPPSTTQTIDNFTVYNRWGQRIFTTANPAEGWDGTFRRQPAPPGAYIWAIIYTDLLTGRTAKAEGTVLLIR